jgi:hypothetical protein
MTPLNTWGTESGKGYKGGWRVYSRQGKGDLDQSCSLGYSNIFDVMLQTTTRTFLKLKLVDSQFLLGQLRRTKENMLGLMGRDGHTKIRKVTTLISLQGKHGASCKTQKPWVLKYLRSSTIHRVTSSCYTGVPPISSLALDLERKRHHVAQVDTTYLYMRAYSSVGWKLDASWWGHASYHLLIKIWYLALCSRFHWSTRHRPSRTCKKL